MSRPKSENKTSGTCKDCKKAISVALDNCYIAKNGSICSRCKQCYKLRVVSKKRDKLGMEPGRYEEIMALQSGKCKVCRGRDSVLVIDREANLLCRRCKALVNFIGGSRDTLDGIGRYLGFYEIDEAPF